jgi:hypothetical protein
VLQHEEIKEIEVLPIQQEERVDLPKIRLPHEEVTEIEVLPIQQEERVHLPEIRLPHEAALVEAHLQGAVQLGVVALVKVHLHLEEGIIKILYH